VKHLLQLWQDFSSAVKAAPHVLLLSDYDGTLTPIVGRPEDAILSPSVREKLTSLGQKPGFTIGIISGRSLEDTKSMAAIEGIYYAGNHGLEIEGPDIDYISPLAEKARETMRDLAGSLAIGLDSIDGVIVQDKGLSLSVHYRLVKPEHEDEVKEAFSKITAPLVDEGKILITYGKKVLEVRPPIDWHKGKAVETIRREIMAAGKIERMLTIYMGDDQTDEDGFRSLSQPEGWSIYVGGANSTSVADYYLDSTEEVEMFLSWLMELK